MKRRFPFHSNTVWPSGWMIFFFAAIYGILESGLWLLGIATPGSLDVSDVPDVKNIRTTILVIATIAYAFHRLWRFHPACNQAYAAWLKSTPWTANKPLPLGPVHWVWQDAVVLGTLTAIAIWHAGVRPALLL